ncbi:type III-A CRISPR-associated RAMP protein Csm3 [Carboxydocella sp. JDF658]|uniref:type III-A CRISPR-associated RAMP protein Csm3 n=1 Tax=Carboxydocella sp. JDF658 TaxID=1926600 RepID=UPI0009AEC154|nr:type III-A CRISPR-associated RAMP protein Csm3 [Carboxydocella sp. JDF658]GAW32208.1 type III-A CRISPR-associated RAMP protein Csm3 [Carboxydocella sp. JDF658]
MKLKKFIEIKGTIVCETGLRIGGSKDDIEIGGMDNPIIRHPITREPYIPGSSLKGKQRSLLELKNGKFNQDGRACACGECDVCKIFGSLKNEISGPTRLLVRDAYLTEDSRIWLNEARLESGIDFAEVKTENWINRKTGKAGTGGLRTQERVPAGTRFKYFATLRVFEGDDEQLFINKIKEALSLLQKDYLGSSGSRGYGKIRFEDLTIDGKPVELGD